jgi:hypothetical protein
MTAHICRCLDRDRIANFLAVPAAIEKVRTSSFGYYAASDHHFDKQITLLGALLCLDSFLYYFTILPVRTLLAILSMAWESLRARRLQ